ncbi:MAG: hypothetical protein DCC52_19140 [Chloroflexi bacterium]|nr:MAG: hypothetical protein DCC52_19140 [Chloroflexota bacterium]
MSPHFGRNIHYAIYRAIRAVCFVCSDNYFRRGMDGKGIVKSALIATGIALGAFALLFAALLYLMANAMPN